MKICFTKSQLTDIWNQAVKGQGGGVTKPDIPTFQGFKDLTTKFLNYAKGKTTLSKQEIMDFAKRPELKKGEADLLNKLAKDLPESKLPAQEFADSIRRDLLELKPVKVKNPEYGRVNINETIPTPYERVGEAKKYLRKSENYEEVVFESPITTNGSSHFPNSKNYFAHARGDEVVESGKKIWREQEIQSDILQKEGLETLRTRSDATNPALWGSNTPERLAEIEKLQPFTNDRFGERIMRERIKEKASKGYEKYRLPTGETIGKIEGFQGDNWVISTNLRNLPLEESDLMIGMKIQNGGGEDWIITDILGDGRFKAVPKSNYQMAMDVKNGVVPKNMEKYIQNSDLARIKPDDYIENLKETFDLTGKSNPQYRRYSDWGKFLKNKYGGKEVVDPQGNSWIEIDLKPEYKKAPIEAFGLGLLPALKEQDENNQSTQKRISFLKKNQ